MILGRQQKYTREDYFRLPDQPRVELIEGDFFLSPAPNVNHQEILWNIVFRLKPWTEEQALGKTLLSPVDVVLSKHNVIQPDIVFVSKGKEHIIHDLIAGSPDLAIEILSSGHASRDRVLKKALYEKFEVQEYWIVDPKHQTVAVMNLENGKYQHEKIYAIDDTLSSSVVPGFKLPVRDVFRNLRKGHKNFR